MITNETLKNVTQSLELAINQINSRIYYLEQNKERSQELIKNEYDKIASSILILQTQAVILELKHVKSYVEDALNYVKTGTKNEK